MRGKQYKGYIAGAFLVVLVIYFIVVYNSLVKKEELVKKQWNEVNSAYQRRLDLVPNLVNVVKGQADYEQTVLQQVTEARANAIAINARANDVNAEDFKKQSDAQDNLAGASNRLLVSIEKYPELKGTSAFKGLQTQLEGTERRIKIARKDFNTAIADYNSYVKSFPTNIAAKISGFKAKEGFQSDAGTDKVKEVKFN